AYCGFGYWALVWQQIAVQMMTTLLILSLCKWKPSFIIRLSEVGSLLAFGSNLSGFNVFNYFARNTDNFLIGYFWGTAELGLYSKAYQLLMFPIQKINVPVSTIAIPSLSRIVQEEERYKKAYLEMVEKIAILMMPVVVFMIIDSKWLIQILLGSQWVDARSIFAWLGFAALIQPITNTAGWIFITRGQTRQMFYWGVFSSLLTIISILIGLPWGALGVAISYSLSGLFVRAPLLFSFVEKISPIRFSDYISTLKVPFMSSVFVFFSLNFVHKILAIENPFYGILLHCFISFFVYVTITTLFYGKEKVRKIISSLR
ncbi:MAG: oligosaccharide flippase family protein, partial [Bacteroidota bacterium]